MKVVLAVCMALLAVVLVQAEDEMAPPVLRAASRVANGRPAMPREFPFMAYIEGFGSSGSLWARCAGSLITRSAVLTRATYCVEGANMWTVRLGSIYRTGEDPNAWSVVTTWAMSHPKYNDNNRDYNIGIIHLPRQAPLNEFIQLVSLPSSPVVTSYVGRRAIVAGWGYTTPSSGPSDVLRWADVLLIPNHYCKQFQPSDAVTDRQLCAGSFSTTVFDDDWAAPLVLSTRGRYIQIGLNSRLTSGDYNSSHPVIYTRVDSFLDWIKLNTESD